VLAERLGSCVAPSSLRGRRRWLDRGERGRPDTPGVAVLDCRAQGGTEAPGAPVATADGAREIGSAR
jgi:hypothetical protein